MDIKLVVEDDVGEVITSDNLDLVIDYINDELVDTLLINSRSNDFSENNPDLLNLRNQILRLYDTINDIDFYFDVNSETWKIFRPNLNSYLYDDLYISLDIEELRHSHTHGTNQKLEDAFGLIYPYKKIGFHYWEGSTHDSSIYYKPSDLKNISKLTIKFFDSQGNQIKFDHLSRNAVSTKDSRHPLNQNIQTHLTFIIGVVESTQNREVNFSR